MALQIITINIEDADPIIVSDYGYYCNEKIDKGELPLSFIQWLYANTLTLATN